MSVCFNAKEISQYSVYTLLGYIKNKEKILLILKIKELCLLNLFLVLAYLIRLPLQHPQEVFPQRQCHLYHNKFS